MSIACKYAWGGVESNIFAWLVTELGAVEDQTAFLGEFKRAPALHLDEAGVTQIVDQWMFHMHGGSDQIIVQRTQVPLEKWRFNGEFVGVFGTRTAAQEMWGSLADLLPAGSSDGTSDPKGVINMNVAGAPTLTRDVIRLKEDQASAGDLRVWVLRQTLDIAFKNIEQTT